MNLLRTVACQRVLSEIKCAAPAKTCWEFFLRILEVPRLSGYLDPIRLELRSICSLRGWNYDSDEIGNVLISVPASKGYEHVPSVCFQGHCDMVCVADEGVTHDFKKDSIVPKIDGEWLRATGTSLGSDNGAGLAIALSILADKTLIHGPLEVLVTVDEETSMVGVNQLRKQWLKSKLLINVDSEQERAICIGCAGGFNSHMTLPVIRTPCSFNQPFKVKVSGLNGGHSGVDIHKQRSSAIQLLGRLLFVASMKSCEFRLVSITGGAARNAIPKSATAVVLAKEPDDLIKVLNNTFDGWKAEISAQDPEARLDCGVADLKSEVAFVAMDEASTRKAAAMIFTAPYGVLRMSLRVPNLVETSFATTLVSTGESSLLVTGMGRSFKLSEMVTTAEWIKAFCNGFGAVASDMESPYPGWNPNPDSDFLKVVQAAHNEVLQVDPVVYAIHAGLECGIITDKYPGMDCISIGPHIEDPHSPQEKVLIPSVERCLQLARRIVEKVATDGKEGTDGAPHKKRSRK